MSDTQQELVKRAEQREAMKRTARSVIKGSAIVGAFIGYCTLAYNFPDTMANISIAGFLAVLIGGLIRATYVFHLSNVRNRD